MSAANVRRPLNSADAACICALPENASQPRSSLARFMQREQERKRERDRIAARALKLSTQDR